MGLISERQSGLGGGEVIFFTGPMSVGETDKLCPVDACPCIRVSTPVFNPHRSLEMNFSDCWFGLDLNQ